MNMHFVRPDDQALATHPKHNVAQGLLRVVQRAMAAGA